MIETIEMYATSDNMRFDDECEAIVHEINLNLEIGHIKLFDEDLHQFKFTGSDYINGNDVYCISIGDCENADIAKTALSGISDLIDLSLFCDDLALCKPNTILIYDEDTCSWETTDAIEEQLIDKQNKIHELKKKIRRLEA